MDTIELKESGNSHAHCVLSCIPFFPHPVKALTPKVKLYMSWFFMRLNTNVLIISSPQTIGIYGELTDNVPEQWQTVSGSQNIEQ